MISDRDLAWLLADAVQPCLDDQQRAAVVVDIGAGDHIAGIERIQAFVVRGQLTLSNDLRSEVGDWLRRVIEFVDGRRIQHLFHQTVTPAYAGDAPSATRTVKLMRGHPMRSPALGHSGHVANSVESPTMTAHGAQLCASDMRFQLDRERA